MSDKTCWESIKGEGQGLMDKLKAIVHEGNVRRVIVKHQGAYCRRVSVDGGRRGRASGTGA